jgi:hypothetical protein
MQHCVKVTIEPRRFWIEADTEEEAESIARQMMDIDYYSSEAFEYEVVEILDD